jgi:hypothetical protein
VAASASSITDLVEEELLAMGDPRVVAHIRGLLVTPRVEMRGWDYGEPDQEFPCWIVLEHAASNTGIAYSEHGFGPSFPWGIVFLGGAEHMSMGMDSAWFDYFMEAYFESAASMELPIWRVFRSENGQYPGEAITPEGSWDETWAEVMRLRGLGGQFKYNCSQSVYARDA